MASAEALEGAYRARLGSLLVAMTARLERLYGSTVRAGDLDATFADFAPQAASLIAIARDAGVTLSMGYLRALFTSQAGVPIEPAAFPSSTNEKGKPLAAGMAAIPAMMKLAVGQGKPLEQVMDFGRSLTVRYADAETTRAIDEATEQISRDTPQVVGWEGIVAAGSCSACQRNSGRHSLDTPIYRHGGCNCTRQFVVAA